MRPTYLTTRLIEEPESVRRYEVGGHTHYKIDFHFVWRARLNRKLFGPVLTPFLVEQIDEVCASKKIKRLGVAVAANHVHLCARLRPSHAPANVMRWIKSTTSMKVFEKFPQIEERFGMRKLWGRGYHVESLGDKNVFAILAYLGRQDDKHDLRALEGYFQEVEAYLTEPPVGEDVDDDDADE